MAIVLQKDKRSGITYAYESTSYWVKEIKQSRCRRKLIGRVDESSGEIIPTDGRNRKASTSKVANKAKPPKRTLYGATYLFDCIGKNLGITPILKTVFPDSYKQILSLAYFLVMEHRSPLFRFKKWANDHHHPYGRNIPSMKIEALFSSIQEADKQTFFKLFKERHPSDVYWVFNNTSLASYGQQLNQVKYGKGKGYGRFSQIELAIVYNAMTQIPCSFQLSKDVTDLSSLDQLLQNLDSTGYKNISVVLDRNFYSKDNIHALYRKNLDFLQAIPLRLAFILNAFPEVFTELKKEGNYSKDFKLYSHAVCTTWSNEHTAPYGESERKMYIYYYYSNTQAAKDKKAFDLYLQTLQEEIETGRRNIKHEDQYKKFFTTSTIGNKAVGVTTIQEAVTEIEKQHGYFAYISNLELNPIDAHRLYRFKELSEESFSNLEDRLRLSSPQVSSIKNLEGMLFIEFIAVLYVTYVKNMMETTNLQLTYTGQGILDTLDSLSCVQAPGTRLTCEKPSKKQHDMYVKLGIKPPKENQTKARES